MFNITCAGFHRKSHMVSHSIHQTLYTLYLGLHTLYLTPHTLHPAPNTLIPHSPLTSLTLHSPPSLSTHLHFFLPRSPQLLLCSVRVLRLVVGSTPGPLTGVAPAGHHWDVVAMMGAGYRHGGLAASRHLHTCVNTVQVSLVWLCVPEEAQVGETLYN